MACVPAATSSTLVNIMTLDELSDTLLSLPTMAAVLEVVPELEDFRLVRVNDPLKAFIRSDEDPVGRVTGEFVYSRSAPERIHTMASACATRREVQISEETFLLRDGSVIHVRMTMVPFEQQDRVTHIVITMEDTTELTNLRLAHTRQLALAASGFVEMCAWCNSINADGEWLPPTRFVEEVRHGDDAPAEHLCPDCATG